MSQPILKPFSDNWRNRIAQGRAELAGPVDANYGRWTLLPGLILVALAAMIAAIAGHHAGFDAINGRASALPPRLWSVLNAFGDTSVGLAALLFFAPRRLALTWITLLAAIFGLLVSHGPKQLFPLPRPGMVLDPATLHTLTDLPVSGTFPSGHSVTVAMLAAVLMLIAQAHWQRALLLLAALALALSRVAIGVHWPVDVMAGAGLGLICGYAGVYLARLWPKGVSTPIAALVLALMAASAVMLVTGHPSAYPLAHPVTRLFGLAALAFGLWSLLGSRAP